MQTNSPMVGKSQKTCRNKTFKKIIYPKELLLIRGVQHATREPECGPWHLF